MCIAAFLWAVFAFISLYSRNEMGTSFLQLLSDVAILYIPGFLYLHTWQQVSYKYISGWRILMVFAVPLLMTTFMLQDPAGFSPVGRTPLYEGIHAEFVLFHAYMAVMIVAGISLCLQVFFHMPEHMKTSAYYLLGAQVILFFFGIVRLMLNGAAEEFLQSRFAEIAIPLLAPIAVGAVISLPYNAFSINAAEDVIVTSRAFVVENLSTMILVLSNHWQILDWNRKEDETILLPEPKYKEMFSEYQKRIIGETAARVSRQGEEIISIITEDREISFLFTVHDVCEKDHQFGYLVEINEVTNVYAALRALEDIVLIDQLTGLYNRNAYVERVRTIVEKENLPLLVMVGDVNNLKVVNDEKGHLSGDALLNTVAKLIEEELAHDKKTGFIARIGGDEFVVLLTNEKEEWAEAFVASIEEKCAAIKDENFGTPSISWGYALMDSMEQAYNDVFAKADQMMYASKRARHHFRSSGFVASEEGEEK
ncbi:MAG: diguanylate cyclase domain-containing protein [Christensenellaceae bacterium]